MLATPQNARARRTLVDVTDALTAIFVAEPDKRAAHRRATAVLAQASREPSFITGVLEKHLEKRGALEALNYPVVSLTPASTPYFELAVNCWIPLPSADTNVTTKAIHHHGTLLLSTATIFGPGYEHLLFTRPELVDREQDRFAMELTEAAPHPLHHVAFVDAWIPHVPLYPSDLTITLALWSGSQPTTWKDRVKRIPLFKKNEKRLRKIAGALGVTKHLDLKVVEYFDYYPSTEGGFRGMRERQEFPLGPNEHHLRSLFHTIQRTNNAGLASSLRRSLSTCAPATRASAAPLLDALLSDRPIDGHLSEGHFGVPFANFTKPEIVRAVARRDPPQMSKNQHGR